MFIGKREKLISCNSVKIHLREKHVSRRAVNIRYAFEKKKKRKREKKKGKKGEKMIKTFICIYICITLVKKSGTVI